ncbi:MAG: AmmeMemoRadiSam system radical SAM enzyme [Deltaproteobacteria bacterium]|nr:AmmeMemoRadiSam system radical SAM enzyme [Deltaproteobacteria bacterium]
MYGEYYSPKDIVDIAIKNHSESISYTYTEPTVFADYAIDVIEQSKEMKSQLYHVFVTNGYMSDELISRLEGLLDAANIDLKSFSDEFYKKVCKARLAPVLNTIKQFFNMNIHIEITTLLIPTLNDSDEELEKIAEFIASISPDIPWHISRYHPDYKLDISSTPTESISRAREIGRKSGLKFVYSGNIWGDEGENTYCPNCNKLLIRRVGFSVIENNISNSCCKFCNAKVYGRFSK